jgi:hypothetical protein
MAYTIATTKPDAPLPKVDFTWSPVGAAVTFNFAGNNYPPAGDRFASYYSPVNQLITFVAAVVPPAGVAIVEYRWDLGDGITKFGATVGHTYNVPNPSLAAKLEVLDSHNRRINVQKVLNLQVQYGTIVQDHARV